MADFGIGEGAAAAGAAAAGETAAATAAEATAAAAASSAAATAAEGVVATSAATTGLTVAQWLGIASAAGSVLSTAGRLRDASNQSTMARLGQKGALAEARSKQDVAAYGATQFARRASLLVGQQVATTAAAGLSTQSGTPLFNELDATRQAELEKQNILRTGDVGAASSRFEAGLAGFRSQFFDQQAGGIIGSGLLQGAGSLLDAWTRKRGGYGV